MKTHIVIKPRHSCDKTEWIRFERTKCGPTYFDWIEFEQPTKFARSKFERPKVGLQGELQDVIRNAGPKGRIHGCIL